MQATEDPPRRPGHRGAAAENVHVDHTSSHSRLREALEARLLGGATTIHVTIHPAADLDERAWAVLVGASRQARRAGGELVVNVHSALSGHTLRTLGLHRVLTVRWCHPATG